MAASSALDPVEDINDADELEDQQHQKDDADDNCAGHAAFHQGVPDIGIEAQSLADDVDEVTAAPPLTNSAWTAASNKSG